jgi:uncharacterized RDD family membrane protein YckC
LLAALAFFFTLAVLVVRMGRAVPAGSVWFEAALLGVAVAFFCGFWTHGGQTVGMRAWHIRVESADGTPLTLRHAALRFLAALVSVAAAGLGFWWCLVDRERRAWHDIWAKTRVVRGN